MRGEKRVRVLPGGIPGGRAGRAPPKAAALVAALLLANAAAWAWALATFGGDPALTGTALLAWVLGLRHAVDADHVAAIDNVVRKLMQEGGRPIAVGLFFALGHSTVVFLASLAVAATATVLQGDLERFGAVGAVVGTSVSALFLLLIGVANLIILVGVWRAFRRAARGGPLDEESLDALLAGRGLLARLFRPLFRTVARSWHMYPLGFLFGLGFDTATQIGVLSISATQAAQGTTVWGVLVFPALFAAGMALVDSLDSILMVGAYGWAFVNPIRKLWYNLTITAASVVVAFLIGGIEALGLIAARFGLEGGVWSAVAALGDSLATFGFLVVGVFLLAWLASVLVYRWKRYDELAPARPR